MNNIVEGIIEKLFKGQVKEHPTYGPSAPFSITVHGIAYKTFANLKKGDPFKMGDKVKFQFEEKFNDYNGSMENSIVKGTLENLSNPEATTKKAFGGGYKPDPERDLRIVNQSQITNAISILCHNSPDLKVKKEDVLRLASELVEWVYINKPKGAAKPAETAVKNDVPPTNSYPEVVDDDIPF